MPSQSKLASCSRCGQVGHAVVQCPKPFLRPMCTYCKRMGHLQANCYSKRDADRQVVVEARQVQLKAAFEVRANDRQAQQAIAEERGNQRAQWQAARQQRIQRQNDWDAQAAQRKIAQAAGEAAAARRAAEAPKWEAERETRTAMTATMALKRITLDLKAMQASPLPGISAEPFDDDLQTWHFNVRGARGELEGLVLHGVLRFPPTYPVEPPMLRLCTPAPHPNVSRMREGYDVCMDVLSVGASTPYGGWSSSYTVGSLLLQLQSTLFDERAIEDDRWSLAEALAAADALECPCGHCMDCSKPAFVTESLFGAFKVVSKPTEKLLEAMHLLGKTEHDAADDDSTCASEVSNQPQMASSLESRGWGIPAPNNATAVARKPVQNVSEGDCILAYFKVKGGDRSRRRDTAEVLAVDATTVQVRYSDGTNQLIPKEWVCSIVRSAETRTARLDRGASIKECEAFSRAQGPLTNIAPKPQSGVGKVSHRLLIEVLMMSAPEDAANFASCSKYLASLGEDGLLWKVFFSQRYSSSELSAESMADWKHCFLLEINGIEADMTCFHMKTSFKDCVLGLPIDFSTNPRTHKVDYISTTLDYLSLEAYDSGVRKSQWNESFQELLPLYLTADHFQRAKSRFEATIFKLSPHWPSDGFEPGMVLEVIPKLMNTMIVLLCDKGLSASDRALDGYFLLWRLLSACVDIYGLRNVVHDRWSQFMVDDKNRTKAAVPSLGDLLPLLSVCSDSKYSWNAVGKAVLNESADRNVLWSCKANPEFAREDENILGASADVLRLEKTFESTKVSKRLFMFHVAFLELVNQQTTDVFFGRPSRHVRAACKTSVQKILDVASWIGFFEACRQPCTSDAGLTDYLKTANHNSLRKGYHTSKTDFSRIHASGVSHILKKGQSYQVANSVSKVHLLLGSDSQSILCGACLVYEDLTCTKIVHYGDRYGYGGAIKHSGDTTVNGCSKHTMNVDLNKLPSSVTRLFFTLCACGAADLSHFKNPAIELEDESASPLCQYNLETAGRAPTVVMAAICRTPDGWQVTALGVPSDVRCCGNYNTVKRDVRGIQL